MFNEGYNSAFAEHPIRKDVCLEAMRLCKFLTEHPSGSHPGAFALMALMCFHAARFDARLDAGGNLLTLKSQDRSLWNKDLIQEGFRYLARSASGKEITEIHLEAGIAAAHCAADRYEKTDWVGIVRLYDRLVEIKPSPIVALNRAIALSEVRGPRAALAVLQAIPQKGVLKAYYLFPATLGELHFQLGEFEEASRHFERAIALTSSRAEKQFLRRKLQTCQERPSRGASRVN